MKTSWIGTRWRARCNMILPKGPLQPGDEFVYDERCEALGLSPEGWLAAGNAEQIKAKPLSESVAAPRPDTAAKARPPRRIRTRPEVTDADA